MIIGPTFAKDVGTDKKSYIELSGNKDLIDILSDDNFIINYNEDKIGLEISGALKNVITILYSFVEELFFRLIVKSKNVDNHHFSIIYASLSLIFLLLSYFLIY